MQAGDPAMLQFVEERWEDVQSKAEGLERASQEEFGLLNSVQVLSCSIVTR